MTHGPDFLCVGMPKAGTGWLSDQLITHADFWMPPVKEIAYLHRPAPSLGTAKRLAEKSSRRAGRKGERKELTDRDRAFFATAAEIADKPMDVKSYARLFEPKGAQISGDITPGYASLKEDTIEKVAAEFPHVKVVLMIRDPIERVWSHLSLLYREEKFDPALATDEAGFRDYLDGWKGFLGQSSASRTFERWQKAAPQIPLRVFFYEDLSTRPEWVRSEILTFVGADPAKPSGDLAPDYNRKAGMEKLEMTPMNRSVLVEALTDELRNGALRFGSFANDWAKTYGVA